MERFKDKKIILGCSGGPDSMALLHMMNMAKVHLIVAHVNYHHRPTAERDQKITEDYCRRYGIKCCVLHPSGQKGNFQSWAREVRYDFFKGLCDEHNAEAIAVAHQKDDLVETYLFQKQRNSVPEHWGLKEIGFWKDIPVYRPLLNYRKKQLEEFCIMHKIDYGIDESNLKDDYTRNRIRHQYTDKMNDHEIDAVIKEINMKNEELARVRLQYEESLKEPLSLAVLKECTDSVGLLGYWIKKKGGLVLGRKQTADLYKQLQKAGNLEIDLQDCVKLSKMYENIEIHRITDVSYCYVLDKIEMLRTPYFEIKDSGKGVEAVTLHPDDFPITIRNAKSEDAIELRFGTKKLSRWFIDRKIPREMRKSWPVVLNRHGKVILVPQIGCDVKHYSNNPTCFVVK